MYSNDSNCLVFLQRHHEVEFLNVPPTGWWVALNSFIQRGWIVITLIPWSSIERHRQVNTSGSQTSCPGFYVGQNNRRNGGFFSPSVSKCLHFLPPRVHMYWAARYFWSHAAVFLSPISFKHPHRAAQSPPEDSSRSYWCEIILPSIHPSVRLSVFSRLASSMLSSSSASLSHLSSLLSSSLPLPLLHSLSSPLPAVRIIFSLLASVSIHSSDSWSFPSPSLYLLCPLARLLFQVQI